MDEPGCMPRELKLMMAMSRRLPRIKGSNFLGAQLKRFYLRRSRPSVVAPVLGFQMKLDPSECVDGRLLFCPHLYDSYEFSFLEKCLRPGDVFLDVGAHIGIYSLVASKAVGSAGRVLAVEADPGTFERLCFNLRLNGVENVRPLNLGVSGRRETLRLGINSSGNRGASSFLSPTAQGVLVECYPLLDLLRQNQVDRVSGAKFDIEGFEFRVLDQFFADAAPALYPNFIIIERNPEWLEETGQDPVDLLRRKGYQVHWSSKLNYIMFLH